MDVDREGSGRRLARLIGVDPGELHSRQFVNLFDRPVGQWDPRLARARAAVILMRAGRGRFYLVLLGRRVAAAFGLDRSSFFGTVVVEGVLALLLPHPSSRNRVYNDPAARRRARDAIRRLSRNSGQL